MQHLTEYHLVFMQKFSVLTRYRLIDGLMHWLKPNVSYQTFLPMLIALTNFSSLSNICNANEFLSIIALILLYSAKFRFYEGCCNQKDVHFAIAIFAKTKLLRTLFHPFFRLSSYFITKIPT